MIGKGLGEEAMHAPDMTAKELGQKAITQLEANNQAEAAALFIQCANSLPDTEDGEKLRDADAIAYIGLSLLKFPRPESKVKQIQERIESLSHEYDDKSRALKDLTKSLMSFIYQLNDIRYVGELQSRRMFDRPRDVLFKIGTFKSIEDKMMNNSLTAADWCSFLGDAEAIVECFQEWSPKSVASKSQDVLSRSGFIKEGKYTLYVNLILQSDDMKDSIKKAGTLIEQREKLLDEISEVGVELAEAKRFKDPVLDNAKAAIARL